MNSDKATWMLFVCLGFAGGLIRPAVADEWDQKTTVTFSQPVEIPGQVLPAGTYVFKLADSMSDRNIVQVYNSEENHLYGTFLTIPDERLRPASKTIVTFDERQLDHRRPYGPGSIPAKTMDTILCIRS